MGPQKWQYRGRRAEFLSWGSRRLRSREPGRDGVLRYGAKARRNRSLNAHDISASGSLQESHADLPGIAAERQPGNLFDAQAILVVPALLFLLVFFGYPLMRLVYLSVDGPHLTFRHYISFFTEGYGSVLSRTISVSGVVTASCLVIGYPIAFVLATSSPKRRTLLLLAVLVPYLTSSLVRSYAWIVILDDKGVVNSLLQSVGFISAPLDLLYNYISVWSKFFFRIWSYLYSRQCPP
jgi:hypothetical protein